MVQTVWNGMLEKIRENPDQQAVFDNRRSLTRKELGLLAASIAERIPSGTRIVGIIMDHGVEMIAAMFAALMKGAAYVPAEPSFPKERIRYMMRESGVTHVIGNEKYAHLTPDLPHIAAEPGFPIDEKLLESGIIPEGEGQDEESLMYVLYTSGTTGKPKGVSVTNRNVCHYVRAFSHEFHPADGDVMLQYSVCSFDIFVEEVYTTLLNGATLAIPDEADKRDISHLMDYVRKHRVTEISGFPYLLQEMNDLPEIPKSLRLLISGGDVIRGSYIDKIKDQVLVYNTYGPSETTVCASYYNCSDGEVLDDGTYPVGKAVLGSEIRILNEAGTEVPDGEVGEICIFGDGVSNGYIGDRAEENKAFSDLPNGGRMYRSGDLGYVLPDGNIAFLHRKDTQVMILGKRIEVSEVANVLLQSALVRQAYVLPKLDRHHLSYMVAYVVKSDPSVSVAGIKEYLKDYLTPFMIPEFFVELDALPLTVNGKVDEEQLPNVDKDALARQVEIRQLTIDDLDLLLTLRMEVLSHVFAEDQKRMTADEWEEIRSQNESYYRDQLVSGGHLACAAYENGQLAGCGGVCIYREMPSPDNRNGICAYLMNIYTRKSFRNRGIGRRTAEWLIDKAKRRGAGKIYLETSKDGRRLYQALGFLKMQDYLKLPLEKS